jgi:hypothetical protein
MEMTFTSDGLTITLLRGLGVSTVVHVSLPGSADTGLTLDKDIKLDSNTRVSIILKQPMFLDCDISYPVKNALSNKLPSFTGSGIIGGGE